MNIPSRVNPFGYDNSLPPGYFRVDFIENEPGAYIETDVAARCTAEVEVMFLSVDDGNPYGSSWGNYKFANSRGTKWQPRTNSAGDGYTVNLYACFDVGSVELNKKTLVLHESGAPTDQEDLYRIALTINGTTRSAGARDPNDSTVGYRFFEPYRALARLYSVRMTVYPENSLRHFIPVLDASSEPCVLDEITGKTFRNIGTGKFVAGLTLEQVRNLALPTPGNSLTLSVPYDSIGDKRSQYALEKAQADGWELSIRYREPELPEGYTLLDHIATSGEQYLTTDMPATGSMKFEMEFVILEPGSLSVLYGEQESEAGAYSSLYTNYNLGYGYAGRFIYGSTYYYPVFKTGQFQTNVTYHIVVDGADVYRNDDKMRYRMTVNGTSQIVDSIEPLNFVSTLPISVFAPTGIPARRTGSKRMYYFRASDHGEIKLNLVPALDTEGIPCMYDLVSKKAYRSDTSTPFIAGLADSVDLSKFVLPSAGGTITLSVSADASEEDIAALEANNPNWQIAVQYRQ